MKPKKEAKRESLKKRFSRFMKLDTGKSKVTAVNVSDYENTLIALEPDHDPVKAFRNLLKALKGEKIRHIYYEPSKKYGGISRLGGNFLVTRFIGGVNGHSTKYVNKMTEKNPDGIGSREDL